MFIEVVGNTATNNAAIWIDTPLDADGCTTNTTLAPVFGLPVNSTVDPGFEDAANLNFSLRADSVIFTALPGFKAPPFNQMGRKYM